MPIRRDRTRGTGGNAELAFQTRAEVERSRVSTDLRIQQNGPEKDKIAKLGMNDVAMNAHPTKAGRFGNGLMRYQPLLAYAEPVHFHRKADGSCIYRSNANVFQSTDDLSNHTVCLMHDVMKFDICDGPH
jgi:hypothetical protein